MDRVYRETTAEMVTRVVVAIDVRLAVALEVAARETRSSIIAGES